MPTAVKEPVMDTIMPPEKLRPLLAITRREPLSVALAITAGDEEPILLLHKTAGPKKVMTQLKADAAKAKAVLNTAMTRFGVAHVDEDYDHAILRIAINKEAPDKLRVKLTQLVKRYSFKAVEFTVDPALEEEQDNDQDAQPSARQDAPPPAKPADPAALMTDLQALVKRLPTAGARLAEAQALAMRAGLALKQHDPAEAATALALLRETLDAAAAPDPHLQSYDKARRIWLGTIAAADTELLKLTDAIKAAYDPEGLGDAVAAAFTAQARPVVARFDASLAAAIQAAIDADQAQRPGALAEARTRLASLQAELTATPTLALLDTSPIAKVAIAKPLAAALAAIARTLG